MEAVTTRSKSAIPKLFGYIAAARCLGEDGLVAVPLKWPLPKLTADRPPYATPYNSSTVITIPGGSIAIGPFTTIRVSMPSPARR